MVVGKGKTCGVRLSHDHLHTSAVSFVKTPTSSLTSDPMSHFWPSPRSPCRANATAATKLIAKRLWYPTKANIKRHFRRGVLETSTSHLSPITQLLQELVEATISHFIYGTHTLRACSTMHDLLLVAHRRRRPSTDQPTRSGNERYRWPNPLRKPYNLELLPLVRQIWNHLCGFLPRKFTSKWLCRRTLRYFSALTNLQELGIDYSKYPLLCRTSDSALKTSHRLFDSLLSRIPKSLADRSCISLGSSRIFKTSSFSTPPPQRSRMTQPIQT